MCGIVGYTGKTTAITPIIEGLKRLEYRGYDSAGIAIPNKKGEPLFVEKRAGKLSNLSAALSNVPTTTSGIGHTRWATHGGPTDLNAHPHTDESGKLAVIHNGIIENYLEIRDRLERAGIKHKSETDTESVALLLGDIYKRNGQDLLGAMREVCKELRGSFTLLALHSDQPELIVGARRNSPLVVGVGKGENFLASDVSAFIAQTKTALELGQDQIVAIWPDRVEVTDLNGKSVKPKQFEISWDAKAAERGGFSHFMLKEIYEQPKAIADTLLTRADGLKLDLNLSAIKKIVFIACGTAYHAGLVGKYAVEQWAGIPVDVELASEYRYREPKIDRETLVVPISQSGETMDTLMAMRYAKSNGAKVLAICNTNGSTIPRESDAVIYTVAGPEIAVASTKAFVTQLIAIYLLGLQFAKLTKTGINETEINQVLNELNQLPAKVDRKSTRLNSSHT